MPGYKIKFDIVGESPHESTLSSFQKRMSHSILQCVFRVNVDFKFPHVKVKLKGHGLYLPRILFEIGFFPLIACLIVIPIILS